MTTIGVSIAVPDPWGSELQAYRVALGDESAAGIPTHITLLPPIDVEDHLLSEIEEHLGAVSGESAPFTVHLRGTGSFWPVSPVVFVNVVEGISGCELLADAVRRGPLAIDVQFPYHPHVTVAHHLPRKVLDRAFMEKADVDCEFRVDRFWLYVHDEHSGWTPVRDFALEGPEPVHD